MKISIRDWLDDRLDDVSSIGMGEVLTAVVAVICAVLIVISIAAAIEAVALSHTEQFTAVVQSTDAVRVCTAYSTMKVGNTTTTYCSHHDTRFDTELFDNTGVTRVVQFETRYEIGQRLQVTLRVGNISGNVYDAEALVLP